MGAGRLPHAREDQVHDEVVDVFARVGGQQVFARRRTISKTPSTETAGSTANRKKYRRRRSRLGSEGRLPERGPHQPPNRRSGILNTRGWAKPGGQALKAEGFRIPYQHRLPFTQQAQLVGVDQSAGGDLDLHPSADRVSPAASTVASASTSSPVGMGGWVGESEEQLLRAKAMKASSGSAVRERRICESPRLA